MTKQSNIEWQVDGMDCTNCATSIQRFLSRKGLQDVYVNYSTGEVRFSAVEGELDLEEVKKGIRKLGYTVVEEDQPAPFWTLERKVWFSALFTFPLLLDHLLMMTGLGGVPGFHNFWIQFAVCLPVFSLGVWHFGGSALSALRMGVTHMDVLIFMGSTAAFVYSLIGTIQGVPDYIFYETSATIITLVLVGNLLEKRSVRQTTTAIDELSRLQTGTANKLMQDGTLLRIPQAEVALGDLLLVNEGDQIPTDGRMLEGQVFVDESMLTGESEPVGKSVQDKLIGGSLLVEGSLKMRATAVGKNTVLSQMIELVKSAQQEKPNIQRLADRISAIFVPVVVGISLLTFVLAYFAFGVSFQQSLMNSIAVLVISCPCAMGLATPTAVTVGVGRMARRGILVKGGQTLETFAAIRQFVFDKTGTLTSGIFEVAQVEYHTEEVQELHSVIQQLEQRSSHPIARSLLQHFQSNGHQGPEFKEIRERKGWGMEGIDQEGNSWKIGSARILDSPPPELHSLYLTRNDAVQATIDLKDQLVEDALSTIQFLQKRQLKSIVLSGDQKGKTEQVAAQLGIKKVYSEKLPEEKLKVIEELSNQQPTAMIGDGINDAPALARATIGISLSDASQAAIQSAQVVLLNGQLGKLKEAVVISNATLRTIKQNLFWAFAYNLVAIPMAALGFLNPMWGAFFMAFSDVVVIGNSIRLKFRKLKI